MDVKLPSEISVLIVGAGPAGLTAASELVGKCRSVRVLEQDQKYVGGISRTVFYKGFRFDLGGHRFFSKNNDIVTWWHKRLPDDFVLVRRKSRILYGGKFYEYPLRVGNTVRNLGTFAAIRCAASYCWARICPKSPEVSFEDWVANRFGWRLYATFFKTYTEKVWGIPCSEISADWASQRIKGLSLKEVVLNALRRGRDGPVIKTLIDNFHYPRLGPGMMWEKTACDLVNQGMRIEMDRKVVNLRRGTREIESVITIDSKGKHEEWTADAYLLTMPLRDTVLSMAPALSQRVVEAALGLKYRDFLIVALIVEEERLFEDNWIYIHDPSVRVGRIQNFNNWSSQMVPRQGVTCLGMEYFASIGDSIWNLSDDELVELAISEIEQIGLVARSKVTDASVVRVEKAYPVYDHGYQSNVSVIRDALRAFSNVQAIGRNGLHKYNNQDHSMLTGMIAARRILGQDVRDPWLVNSDAEYHETDTGDGGRKVPLKVKKGAGTAA
jgi:protoporphyrinogen oxidase